MPIEAESPEELGYENIECNLAESSVTDFVFGNLDINLSNTRLEYTGHSGKKELRQLIVKDFPGLGAENVLLTNGAAGALFIIHTSLLSKEDHLIVVRPNYATNIEVPKAIGCNISFVDLLFNEEWKVDIDKIKSLVNDNTKLISITTPHNPTGTVMDEEDIRELVLFAAEKNIFLLVDETYRDACFATPYPLSATMGKNVISVSSLSKAFGLPGLRMGWIITQNKKLLETFLAAKEMIYISNPVLDEEVAYHFYKDKEKFATAINKNSLTNFEILKQWLQQEKRLECILPSGGVVCFPRFKNEIKINTEKFYSILFNKYKTLAGPGHWFSMPDTYMRIGFGWPLTKDFEKGLRNISASITEVL